MGLAVVFLDIDGVICCNMAGRLEENKLAVLNQICKATSAKVVLSTDWRRQAQLKRQVVAALKRLDIEVIGATPMRAMFQPIRPQEITEWMHANGSKFGVTSWVAIDDRDLLNEHGGAELQGHMCRTHPNTGLTKRLGDVCIEILGGAPASAEVAENESKESRMAAMESLRGGASPLASTAPARNNRSPIRTPAAASAYGSPAARGARAAPAVPPSFATQAALAGAGDPSSNAFGGPALARATQGALSRTAGPPAAASRGPRATTTPRSLSGGTPLPLTPLGAAKAGAGLTGGTPSTRGAATRVATRTGAGQVTPGKRLSALAASDGS